MKKFLFFLTLLLFSSVFTINSAFAENFYIKNYNLTFNVDQYKTTKILEKIDTFFTQSSHGIYRTIPTGKSVSVNDIWCNEQYQISKNINQVTIKAGNPDVYINGDKTYNIGYIYSIKDNKDEFYFNIIGTQWDTTIQNVNFTIFMPQNIDPSSVKFITGYFGSTNTSNKVQYVVKRNVIYGHTTKALDPNEGITIKVELPKGYFEKSPQTFFEKYKEILLIFLIIFATVSSFLVWLQNGKDAPVIPVVNFYPPQNFNSAETELFFKGEATDKSLISLIFYLANKGYINITQEKKSQFTFKKQKEYQGTNIIEKSLMQILFPTTPIVDKYDLTYSTTFTQNFQKLKQQLNKDKSKIFETNSISTGLKFLMGLFLTINLFTIIISLFNYNIELLMINFGYLIFVFVAIIIFATRPNILSFIWAISFCVAPISILIQDIGFGFDYVALTGIVGLIITGVCFYQLPKRNNYGQKLLNDIAGFKKFIEVAEKHKLENLVQENPQYFYDILPYAYVLDVSNKWIKQFEDIVINEPTWYSGIKLNVNSFNALTNSISSTSTPSQTSSGGSGGFSGGGGCGGGGGGSW